MNSTSSFSLKSVVPALPTPLQRIIQRQHFLKKLQRSKISDEPELPSITQLLSRGDCALDIGANFGLFTRFMSEAVGTTGKVYSFEPTEEMFHVLKNNCRVLGYSNVEPYECALSDVNGESSFVIPLREDGTSNLYEASLVEETTANSKRVVTVKTITLDTFFEQHSIERLDFIKCDVEGHEIAVLRGGRETLAKFQPKILLEINEPLDVPGHGAEVLELIHELEYEVHVFVDGKISPRESGQSFVNYVLLPR